MNNIQNNNYYWDSILKLNKLELITFLIITYKHKISTIEIDEIVRRDSNSISIIQSLLDKRLIKIIGRNKDKGGHLQYGISDEVEYNNKYI